jgi:hypothetical protein
MIQKIKLFRIGLFAILINLPTLVVAQTNPGRTGHANDGSRNPASDSSDSNNQGSGNAAGELRQYDSCLEQGNSAAACMCVSRGGSTDECSKLNNVETGSVNSTSDCMRQDGSGGKLNSNGNCMAISDAGATTGGGSGSSCALGDGSMGQMNADGTACVRATTSSAATNPEQTPAVPDCASALKDATDSCDSEKSTNSWAGQVSMVTQTLGPTAMQLNQNACGGIAATQTAAQASLATFAEMCSSATQACMTACASDTSSLAQCKTQGEKPNQAQAKMAQAMLTMQRSVAACQNAFGSTSVQAQAYCAKNPSDPTCNPNLGTTLQTANFPTDQTGGAVPASGSSGGSSGGSKSNADLSGLNLDSINPTAPGASNNQAAATQDPGGAKGGAPIDMGGNGTQAAGPNGRGGGKKGEDNKFNPLAGFFGGGGGGSFGNAIRSLFGIKSDGYSGGKQVKANGPDLNKFLPGGMYDPTKNRGIAGQFVGLDGMTGPYSDIWKNINNRYQYKRASLLP